MRSAHRPPLGEVARGCTCSSTPATSGDPPLPQALLRGDGQGRREVLPKRGRRDRDGQGARLAPLRRLLESSEPKQYIRRGGLFRGVAAKRKARTITFADRVKPMSLNMGSVPAFAADLGFMSKEGLSVKILGCDGSPQALAATERGDADMAQVNISPVVAEVAKGASAQGGVGERPREPAKAAAAQPRPSRRRGDAGHLRVHQGRRTAEGKEDRHLTKGGHEPSLGRLLPQGPRHRPRAGRALGGGRHLPARGSTRSSPAGWTPHGRRSQTMALFEGKREAFRDPRKAAGSSPRGAGCGTSSGWQELGWSRRSPRLSFPP